jgi:hypothetical protein
MLWLKVFQLTEGTADAVLYNLDHHGWVCVGANISTHERIDHLNIEVMLISINGV